METSARSTDPHICAMCHQRNTGCCQLAPGAERLLFGLTDAECEAIAAATGQEVVSFTQRDTTPPGFLESLRDIHPAFLDTMPGGQRVHLRIVGGRCCFLGECGCTLPEAVRPFYCRLYPIWFTPAGVPMLLRSRTCLAQEGALTLYETMARLDESEARLRLLFDAWLRAAEAHGRAHG